MPKRKYSREFKESAVKLVYEQGYGPAEAARSLGVEPATLRFWVKKNPPPAPGAAPEAGLRDELKRLREENKRLLMEREILKKRRPSSRSTSREIRLHSETCRGVSRGPDV